MKNIDKHKIYKLFKDCVVDGLKHIEENFDPNKMDRWRDQKFHKGVFLPSPIVPGRIPFYWSENSKLYNYNFWLTDGDEYLEFDSFKTLRSELLKVSDYCKHFALGDFSHMTENDIGYGIGKQWNERLAFEEKIGQFVDHYIHKYRSKIFNEDRFKKIFDPWYNYLKSNKLNYDIWIPIIYNKPETDSVKLTENVFLKRLKEDQQITRNLFTDHTTLKGSKSFLIRSCTHAIVIKGWYLEGEFVSENSVPHGISKLSENPKLNNIIDNIIASINIITGIEIGVFQIFIEPKNWVRNYKYKYFTRLSTYIKKYPIKYEETGWAGDAKVIKKNEYSDIRKTIALLNQQNNERIQFAISKLNEVNTKALDREIIFGSTIALESLLCSDSQSEITFRLATRAAYLTTFLKFETWNSNEINQLVKKLYKYRSGVAHGKSDTELSKIRNIKIDDKDVDLLNFSIKFLRHVIVFMLNNQDKITNDKGKFDIAVLDQKFYDIYAI